MKPLTILILFIVVLGAGGVIFLRFIMPNIGKDDLSGATDAGRIKGTITAAGDNYAGYGFLKTTKFEQILRGYGYVPSFHDEGAKVNYAERHQKFAKGEYDIMVLPVNSYIWHGRNTERGAYPGAAAAILSDSKGADNILGWRDKLVPQGNREPRVDDLNNPGIKICVTPDSPSSFLLNTAIVHFALDNLKSAKGSWIETNGSAEAYKKFAKRECDVAVLWEPDVSRALAIPGVVSVYGSHQVSGMIIDFFVAQKELILREPEKVKAYFRAYFETLAYYDQHRDEMISEMKNIWGLDSNEAVEKLLTRIAWFDLEDNCREWFNIPIRGIIPSAKQEKIADTIRQVTDIMVKVGDLSGDPLGGNPYLITIRTDRDDGILNQLCNEMAPAATSFGAVVPVQADFAPRTNEEWAKLKVIGTMRVSPVLFQRATSNFSNDGKTVLDEIASALIHNYPQYRIVIKGHTAPVGDESANLALSQQRADIVKDYWVNSWGVDPDRILSLGVGSRERFPSLAGESEAIWHQKLARVEFVLVEEK